MSPQTRAKIDALKARIRSGTSKLAKGAKGSALAVGVGAIASAAKVHALDKIEFVQEHWYVTPLGLAAAGHFLRRKNETAGIALLGAAGALGFLGYEANKDASGVPRSFADAGALQSGRGYGQMGMGGPVAGYADAGRIVEPAYGG